MFDYTARLESALNCRGNPVSVDAFMGILREVSDLSSGPLSTAERDFLLETTDLTEKDLTPQAHDSARIHAAEDRALAEKEAQDTTLTIGEVAELLGQEEANIHRAKLAGDLYALPPADGGATLFPAWQIDGQQVVPGLRTIILIFPQHVHPLAIQQFMTEGKAELGDRSPVEWLTAGGAVEAVASLVAELGYE